MLFVCLIACCSNLNGAPWHQVHSALSPQSCLSYSSSSDTEHSSTHTAYHCPLGKGCARKWVPTLLWKPRRPTQPSSQLADLLGLPADRLDVRATAARARAARAVQCSQRDETRGPEDDGHHAQEERRAGLDALGEEGKEERGVAVCGAAHVARGERQRKRERHVRAHGEVRVQHIARERLRDSHGAASRRVAPLLVLVVPAVAVVVVHDHHDGARHHHMPRGHAVRRGADGGAAPRPRRAGAEERRAADTLHVRHVAQPSLEQPPRARPLAVVRGGEEQLARGGLPRVRRGGGVL
mmetsp:Transcript_5037/g.12405  ORF Transcript_5037/g.12405 Transcript_5037/m.12405 type:complete len:296 (+) Transcript_5037:164-1051(+)